MVFTGNCPKQNVLKTVKKPLLFNLIIKYTKCYQGSYVNSISSVILQPFKTIEYNLYLNSALLERSFKFLLKSSNMSPGLSGTDRSSI